MNTVANQTYSLSFWVTEQGGPPSELVVRWDGVDVGHFVNPNNSGMSNWIQLSMDNLLATSDATLLEFYGRQDPTTIWVDEVDVEVTGTSQIPEPGTIALLGSGVAALAAQRVGRRPKRGSRGGRAPWARRA